MSYIPKLYYSASPSYGGGSGGIITSWATPAYNMYIDLADFSTVNKEIIDIIIADSILDTVAYDREIVNGTSIVTNTRIDVNGNIIGAFTPTWTNPYTGITNFNISRIVTGIGRQSDRVTFTLADSTTKFTTEDYVSLQKSVAVTRIFQSATYVALGAESNTYITVGQQVQLSKANNRGTEETSLWTVLKSDPLGTYFSIPAILGTDYQYLSGNSLADEVTIQFLTAVNFTVVNSCSGYTFAANPYLSFPGDISPNTASINHYFITTSTSFVNDIKLPTISPVLTVPTNVLLSSNPFSTYQNQTITVTTSLDKTNAYWNLVDNITHISTPQTKTDDEWKAKINSSCNVIFNVTDPTTGSVITTQNGLGPFTITLQKAQNYNLQFVLTLK